MAIEVNSLRPTQPTVVDGQRNKDNTVIHPGSGNGSTANARGTETVTVTHAAENLRQMEKAVADIPVVDAQRVALVRKALLEGTYKVDPERIASKLIQFEKTLL